MDTESSSSLHLPSLEIAGFRGFDHLTIPRLGRVTLLAGRNGVGKTTVLDAVRLFAARGLPSVLADLLEEREELAACLVEDRSPATVPDVAALLHGRGEDRMSRITIGPVGKDGLALEASQPADWTDDERERLVRLPLGEDVAALRVKYDGWSKVVPGSFLEDKRSWPLAVPLVNYRRHRPTDWPTPVWCESLGPGVPENLALWGGIALTDDEDFLVQALRPILDERVDRLAVVVDSGEAPPFRSNRRVIVKLSGHPRPVPLKSFGDGATRLFGAALALTRSRKGLLVIDEAENGLHYTVHEDFWRMVLNAAREGDIQVLATTHSWDCIVGFARAATKCAHTDGALVRLEPDDGGCRAVVYSEEDLTVAADQRIEVR